MGCGRKITRRVNPDGARSAGYRFNVLFASELPCRPGKVGAGDWPESDPSPRPRIHIEKFEVTIASIKLELGLDKSRQLHGLRDAFSGGFNFRCIDGFDKCAGISKIDRVLAGASRCQRGNWNAIFAYGSKGKLLLATAWYQFLQNNVAVTDQRGGFLVARDKRGTIVELAKLSRA